jgi:hypothetical protein
MKNIKFLLLAVVTMIMSANVLSAQRVYNSDELNGKLLDEIFQNAAMKTSNVNDRFLDVKSAYTYNIDLDNNNRYFTISAKYKFSDTAKKADIQDLLNLINKDVAVVKAYTDEKFSSITYIYYFWTEGGFTARSAVSALRLMDAALDLSLQKDKKGVL